ncbi:SubName: Full=Uncharacterized protein {ECO:0000313/EMBL:CCA75502.1} [Serendipita indica DSM 11827]|nr:SubName: Full=Uncharacterized protein {ECO:0000313/EMBL:CCA75502.1} [Serendipita indica DSM 11827]
MSRVGLASRLGSLFAEPSSFDTSPGSQHSSAATPANVADTSHLANSAQRDSPPSPKNPFLVSSESEPSFRPVLNSTLHLDPPVKPRSLSTVSDTDTIESDHDWASINPTCHAPLPPSLIAVSAALESRESAGNDATYVWGNVVPREGAELPANHKELAHPVQLKRPDCKYVACIFCSNQGITRLWRNVDGTTSPIRRHFKEEHEKEWKVICIALKLKNWERYAEELTPEGRAARQAMVKAQWSLDGFLERLTRSIVSNDQPNFLVDNNEFRELLLYYSTSALKNLTNLIEPDPLDSNATAEANVISTEEDIGYSPAELEPSQVVDFPLEYRRVLRRDVVTKLQMLVNACRKSPQRRESLRLHVNAGQEAGLWTFKYRELIRDVETRWSSLYLMIERYLELHTAIDSWLECTDQRDLQIYRLDAREVEVLQHIKSLLEYFHSFQQLLSAERTPSIHLVIPAFEPLITDLTEVLAQGPLLAHAYSVAISKLKEYRNKCMVNPVYAVAMGLFFPDLHYFDAQWSLSEARAARSLLRDEMYQVQTQRHRANLPIICPPVTAFPIGTNPLARKIAGLCTKPIQSSSVSSRPAPATPSQITATNEQKDWEAVDRELRAYEDEETNESYALLEKGSQSLLAYWHSRKERFPILYQLAMDTLPAQGSAVSSERVFSSAKRTITDSCNLSKVHPLTLSAH